MNNKGFILPIVLVVATVIIGGIFAYDIIKTQPDEVLGDARVLTVPQGGTGQSSFTAGECIVGNGSGALTSQSCSTGSGSGSNWLVNASGQLTPSTTIDVLLPDNTYVNGSLGVGTTTPWDSYGMAVATNTIIAGDLVADNLNTNEGMLSDPTIADATGAAVSITSAKCNIRSSATWDGDNRLYNKTIAANATLALTDNDLNYIVVNWNSGNPIYQATTDRGTINNSDIIPVARVMMDSGNIEYQIAYGAVGKSVAIRNFDRVMRTRGEAGIERESGLAISESASRVLTVASGYAWFGMDRKTLAALTVGTDGATADVWYHSSGNWTSSSTPFYDHLSYDNGTNLTALTANRYTVNWVFRNVADVNEIDIVLGTGDYTLAQAEAAMLPAVPEEVSNFYVLVGRIIIQKNATQAYAIENVADYSFRQASVSIHNDLSGLQGGTTGEYYHLTSAQNTSAGNLFTHGRITPLNSTTTNIGTLRVYGNSTMAAVTTTNLAVSGLLNCDTIDTDGSGNFKCGTDASTAGSAGSNWDYFDASTLKPTTTVGFFVSASSTVNSTLRVTGTLTAPGGITGALTGNASTASALSADPSDCAAGTAATAIAANGALTCSITPLISGGTLTSANVCQYDGTGIDCNLVKDSSGDCASGAVCLGDHTHSTYAPLANPTFTGLQVLPDARIAMLNSTTSKIDTLTVNTSLTSAASTLNGLTVAPDLRAAMLNSTTTKIGTLTVNTASTMNGITSITDGRITVVNATSTVTDSLKISGNTIPAYFYPSFTYSTTTAWTGTTTVPLGPAGLAETWSRVMCFTDAGTVQVAFDDGTNVMNQITASTTASDNILSSNNTFTVGEKRYVKLGGPASSPTTISCTIRKNY